MRTAARVIDDDELATAVSATCSAIERSRSNAIPSSRSGSRSVAGRDTNNSLQHCRAPTGDSKPLEDGEASKPIE